MVDTREYVQSNIEMFDCTPYFFHRELNNCICYNGMQFRCNSKKVQTNQ